MSFTIEKNIYLGKAKPSSGGSAPAYYLEKTVDANGVMTNSTNFINLTGVTELGSHVFQYAYSNLIFPANTNIDMSSILKITGEGACANMFAGSSNIKNVDLSGLKEINGSDACAYMFSGSSIQSVDISSLEKIPYSSACTAMFQQTNISTINFNSLKEIGTNAFSSAFKNCPLQSVYFNKLSTMGAFCSTYNQAFAGCSQLENIYFGGLTSTTFSSIVNQLRYLFNTTTGTSATNGCTIHFPSNFDPTNPDKTFDITTLTGYPTFGGNASYIHLAYDLPATE